MKTTPRVRLSPHQCRRRVDGRALPLHSVRRMDGRLVMEDLARMTGDQSAGISQVEEVKTSMTTIARA